MPIAIDGSNLGGALGGRRGARDPQAVLARLLPWLRGRRGRVVLVFDGAPRPDVAARYGAVEVRWSGAEDADAVLLRLVSRGAADWWVATNDRALGARCRALGARVLSVAETLARARPKGPASKTGADGPVDVAFWERFFRGEVE
jgi:hypothetical protein